MATFACLDDTALNAAALPTTSTQGRKRPAIIVTLGRGGYLRILKPEVTQLLPHSTPQILQECFISPNRRILRACAIVQRNVDLGLLNEVCGGKVVGHASRIR